MNESTSDSETSNPTEGPASLREALLEAYNEQTSAEPAATADAPTEEPATLETSNEQEAEAEPSEEQSQGDTEVIQAPEHWSDEDKTAFAELSSAARQSWLRREKEYQQGIQKKADELKPFEEALKPYEQMLQMRGISKADAIAYWANAQSMLDSDPKAALKNLAQGYGIDLNELVDQSADYTPDEYVDPHVKKLQDELNQLKRQNQQVELSQQATHQQEAMEKVRQFKEAKDEQGNLLHPFFDKAQPVMHALVKAGAATDLESAYEQAVASIPEYRESLEKQLREKVEKEAEKKRRDAAEKAKKTATSVKGKGSTPPTDRKPQTLHDDLMEAYDKSLRGEL